MILSLWETIFVVLRNVTWKMELMENGKFLLYAANGKRKRQTSVFLAANVNGKQKFVFLGQQTRTVIDNCCLSKRAYLLSTRGEDICAKVQL